MGMVALALCGCAIFPSAESYIPVVVKVENAKQYALDLLECHAIADKFKPGVSPGSIAQATVSGATSNAAYGVVNPLVPLAGAAGGALTATLGGLDLTGANSIKVLVRCLEEETHRDRSALLADPNG